MQKSAWYYWQQWRQRFPLQRDVHFDQGILSNDYCRDCRYCCGPQDCATPFPMKLLPSQQHAHLDRDFFLLAPDTACLDDRGCKSCGPEGSDALWPAACSRWSCSKGACICTRSVRQSFSCRWIAGSSWPGRPWPGLPGSLRRIWSGSPSISRTPAYRNASSIWNFPCPFHPGRRIPYSLAGADGQRSASGLPSRRTHETSLSPPHADDLSGPQWLRPAGRFP